MDTPSHVKFSYFRNLNIFKMKKIWMILFCCLSACLAFANDGVFYASGNHLIPIMETDISVRKEVLTINRVEGHIEVTVYYEFFNPVGEKELLVGFEAQSAYNGNDPMTTFPEHPHIRNFKVVMNGEQLSFEVAHVEMAGYDKNGQFERRSYYSNGKFKSWSLQRIKDSLAKGDGMDMPVDYVYHFKARFRPGVNVIQHTYDFDLSSSVEEEFYFPYILTAANRWANHQIDDFTLYVNMGDRESFHIMPEFFQNTDEWRILGTGKVSIDSTWGYVSEKPAPVFHIQKGGVSFHKANFHPEGELRIHKRRFWSFSWAYWDELGQEEADGLIGDFKEQYGTLWIMNEEIDKSALTAGQKRILKNMPFAYRGLIFKTRELQDYFESTEWYIPNPDYDGNFESLTTNEKLWVSFWSK